MNEISESSKYVLSRGGDTDLVIYQSLSALFYLQDIFRETTVLQQLLGTVSLIKVSVVFTLLIIEGAVSAKY